MTGDERRAGWLSRVFGAGAEPRPDGPLAPAEAIEAAAVVRALEDELERARAAYGELEARTTEAEGALEAARRDRESARSHANASATKIAGLLDARRAQDERLASQQGELEAARREIARALSETATAHAELAKQRDELAHARSELTKERARTASVQASARQVVATYDSATKRAQEQRALLGQERDAAMQSLGEERAARDAERRAAAASHGELATARRREAEESARRATILRALVERAAQALELALGRGAPLALRAVPGLPTTESPGEAPVELADAVEALAAALRSTGLLGRASLVEGHGEPARVALVAGPCASSSTTRALLALEAKAWLRACCGRTMDVSISDDASAEHERRSELGA